MSNSSCLAFRIGWLSRNTTKRVPIDVLDAERHAHRLPVTPPLQSVSRRAAVRPFELIIVIGGRIRAVVSTSAVYDIPSRGVGEAWSCCPARCRSARRTCPGELHGAAARHLPPTSLHHVAVAVEHGGGVPCRPRRMRARFDDAVEREAHVVSPRCGGDEPSARLARAARWPGTSKTSASQPSRRRAGDQVARLAPRARRPASQRVGGAGRRIPGQRVAHCRAFGDPRRPAPEMRAGHAQVNVTLPACARRRASAALAAFARSQKPSSRIQRSSHA